MKQETKPESVKIIQITGHYGDGTVFGLGDDNGLYYWSNYNWFLSSL